MSTNIETDTYLKLEFDTREDFVAYACSLCRYSQVEYSKAVLLTKTKGGREINSIFVFTFATFHFVEVKVKTRLWEVVVFLLYSSKLIFIKKEFLLKNGFLIVKIITIISLVLFVLLYSLQHSLKSFFIQDLHTSNLWISISRLYLGSHLQYQDIFL